MTASFVGPEGPKIRIGSFYNRPGISFYEPEKEANGTLLITGASGVRKTQKLKDMIAQLFTCGCSLTTLDFHGDIGTPHQETVELTEGPGSSMSLRPLQITPYVIEKYGLYGAASQILSTVESSGRNLGEVQKKILRNALINVWESHGIDENDHETWEERDIPTKEWLKVLSDMQDEAKNATERRAIESAMARVDHMANSSAFNGRYSVGPGQIMSESIRFDLSGLTGQIQIIAAEIILRMISWEAIARSGQNTSIGNGPFKTNKYIIIDEAKILTKAHAKKQESDRLLNVIATEMRKFGIRLIAASQMSKHFDSEVTASAACRLIYHTFDAEEARRISRSANIPFDAVDQIPPQGAALFVKGSERSVDPVITDECTRESGFGDSV